jgi:hypothetical protein
VQYDRGSDLRVSYDRFVDVTSATAPGNAFERRLAMIAEQPDSAVHHRRRYPQSDPAEKFASSRTLKISRDSIGKSAIYWWASQGEHHQTFGNRRAVACASRLHELPWCPARAVAIRVV